MFLVDQIHEVRKQITHADVARFADLSGDANPIHVNPEYAAQTPFQKPIVQGALMAALISASLANDLPGPGCIYLGQTLAFKRPVFVGDTVTVKLRVMVIRRDKPIMTLHTSVLTQDGKVAVEGEATVKLPPGKAAEI